MIHIKKIVLIVVLMFFCSLFSINFLTTKFPQEPSKITVTIGDKQLEYITAKNEWNGEIYDREDTFKTILQEVSENEIPYVEIGSSVTIKFTKNPPSKFTIYDILINNNGSQLYFNDNKSPVELKNGKYSFEIEKNLASGLSSYYEEGKTAIRGFRMIANWGENECEYAFIIRTD